MRAVIVRLACVMAEPVSITALACDRVPPAGCPCARGEPEAVGGARRARGQGARPDNVRPPRGDGASWDADALAGLTTTTAECAEDVDRAPGAPCAGRRVLGAIAAFAIERAAEAGQGPGGAEPQALRAPPGREPGLLPSAPTPEAGAVRAAAAVLGCTSESCVVAHPAFRRWAADQGLASGPALDLELETRFKAPGPREGRALLSNFDIDGTLRRWARVFPGFYPCPFAMMDFETNGDALGELDLADVFAGRAPADLGPGFGVVRRRAGCFGCVLNTDTSAGRGKHWVAVFVDGRARAGAPWTVEYFNSAGNPPPRPAVRWMERARAQLAAARAARGEPGGVESVAVTDVDHQESQTECGLYALFYIRRRLEGAPLEFFFEHRVPDAAMTAFRAHVFRGPGH